jgi:hypothetical protein
VSGELTLPVFEDAFADWAGSMEMMKYRNMNSDTRTSQVFEKRLIICES